MSKSERLKNPFWEEMKSKIKMLAERPKNKGTIREEEAQRLGGVLRIHRHGSCETGMELCLYWVYDPEQERVIASRYTLFGPPELTAVADMAALLTRNKTFEEIGKINYKSLEYFLRDNPSDPALPRERSYLLLFVLRALRSGVQAAQGEHIESSPIVCECAGIDRRSIEEAIEEFDLHSVEEIQDFTLAGSFCGSCIAPGEGIHSRALYLHKILDEVRKKMKEENTQASDVPDKPFKEMSIEEKKSAINAVIDKHIRAMLVMDGGDMEILDLKENGEHTDLYIRYLGACNGCASASTGTLFAIEGILKQKLDPNLRVLPL